MYRYIKALEAVPSGRITEEREESAVWDDLEWGETRRTNGLRRGQLSGLAVATNQRSEDLGFREIIKPDALRRTFRENIDVRALWNHDSGQPLGRLSAGTLGIRRTALGLEVEINPPDSAAAAIESIRRGDVKGMSFGFEVVTDSWSLDDGVAVREITDMRVMEVSPVTFPAYPQTSVAVANGAASDRQKLAMAKARLAMM